MPPSEGGGILLDLGSHLVDQAVAAFGAPEQLFAIVRDSRGQYKKAAAGGAEEQLDDSFTLHLFYPSPSEPLGKDSPAAGTTPAGLHCQLSASVTATHVDSSQLRYKVQGTRGSYVKYGLDPQEAQLKAGWTPASHADKFGKADGEPEVTRLGTLTELQEKNRDWSQEKCDPTKPPALVERKIETMPGRYIDLYGNLGEIIQEANALPAADAQGRSKIIDEKQKVQTGSVAVAIRILELARQSAKEGRVIKYGM